MRNLRPCAFIAGSFAVNGQMPPSHPEGFSTCRRGKYFKLSGEGHEVSQQKMQADLVAVCHAGDRWIFIPP